ncbi:LysM peptidoglycan-binding domain-containing protein [Nocardioides ungokensis]
MITSTTAAPSRCLAVWLASSGTLGVLAWLLLPDLVAARGAVTTTALAGQSFEQLLEWWCALIATVGGAWLWAVTTLVSIQAARGRAHRPIRGVPAPLRRAVLAACGVALVAGVGAPALAAPGQQHADQTAVTTAARVRGLPLPDRATGGLAGAERVGRPDGPAPVVAPVTPVVVVRAGDTLWDLATRTLPGSAPANEVAEAARRIYALNRAQIGPDPDLIRPGQRLRLPRP